MKIKKVISRIRHSGRVTRLLDYEARKKAQVLKKYGCSHGLPTVDLLELLPHFSETIEPYSFLDGAASPMDIAILKGLARSVPGCRYLEIGSMRGESIANVAAVAAECTSISLSVAEMMQLGFPAGLIKYDQHFSRGLANVRHIAHNSLTFDYASLRGKFDLVFIDGDHYDLSVCSDTRHAFALLRDENSMIVWHDYAYSPGSIRWSVLAGILDGTPAEKRGKLYHISHSQCALFSQRTFQSVSAIQPEAPDKCFSIRISLSGPALEHDGRKKN
jgi:predicted O-methyltransferase YrrM